MNYLLIALSPLIAIGFVQWGFVDRIKSVYKLSRLKPFDCEKCMGFWICLALCAYNNVPFIFCISVPFASMAVTVYLNKHINPFYK